MSDNYWEDDYDGGENYEYFADDYGEEPPASGGGGSWFEELKAIREEPNALRKQELLRAVEARYGIRVDPLTKRWIGIQGY